MGEVDSNAVTQKNKTSFYGSTIQFSSQSRNAGVKAINIQKRIRHNDEFLMRYGEERGRYMDALEFRREYCNWILRHPAGCNESVAYFQEYARDRIPRYLHSIGGNPENEEIILECDPMAMTGNGYDAHDSGRRTVPLGEAVWCVWMLDILISDSRSNNVCQRFDWRVNFLVAVWLSRDVEFSC